MSEFLKLSAYLGERDRTDGRFTADALLDIFEQRGLPASLMFRGSEGFGLKHHLQSDRLLTLSEDLPVVALAIDRCERIEAVLDEVLSLGSNGLFTLEPVDLASAEVDPGRSKARVDGSSKLTVVLGRGQRIEGESAFRFVTRLFHRLGLEGATVLLGVDGTVNGSRERGRFFSSNSQVPLAVVSIGSDEAVSRAVEELGVHLADPLILTEDTCVLKRDRRQIEAGVHFGDGGPDQLGTWCRLTVYASEQSRHDGAPLHPQIIHRLREAGALGATATKGIWGYHGNHEPQGDSLRSIRRRIPVVIETVDSPGRCREWFRILDELTDEGGLITSDLVPAMRSRASGQHRGGAGLSGPRPDSSR